VAHSIRALIDSENVVTNRLAVEAGLEFLDRGGDFADGAIAYEGRWLGAEEFVSFDKKAVSLLKSQGKRARLLS
jgi:predicted nucleic-acid-binding protein